MKSELERAARTVNSLVMLVFVAACASPAPLSSPPAAHTPTPATPPTALPTVTPTPPIPGWLQATLSPRPPVLSPDEQERLLDLLSTNGGCSLPCFLGVTPGRTSWDDMVTLLQPLNEVHPGSEQFLDNGWPYYSVPLTVLTPSGGILFALHVTVGEELVQRIHLYIEANDLPSFYSYWSRYSLRSMLQQLGAPDRVYVYVVPAVYGSPGYSFLVIDEDDKTAIWLTGDRAREDRLCPQFGDGDEITNLEISIANPASEMEILPSAWIPETETEFWHPIDQVLGIDAQSFYERMLSQTPACFALVSE